MIMKGFLAIACATESSPPVRRKGGCDLAIGAGFAARDGAGVLIDALVEGGDALDVERDIGKIAGLAAQQRHNALDRELDHRRRTLLACLRIEPVQPPPRLDFARFRQLHADDPGIAPYDAAAPDAGVKDRVTTPHNATPARKTS
jgi:hypothetical protein